MDAESRWFYAVGLSFVILGILGLLVRALGAAIPSWAGWALVGLVLLGILVFGLGRRGLVARWRAWRASRPKPWPAGWKMEKR